MKDGFELRNNRLWACIYCGCYIDDKDIHRASCQERIPDVVNLSSSGTYYIAGKGTVLYFDKNTLPERMIWSPEQLKGKIVNDRGTKYYVTGVETFRIGGVSLSQPYTLSFGLLVRKVEDEG